MGRTRIFLRLVGRSFRARLERFRHDRGELVMLIEGEEEFEIGGQKHHLKIGEELLIPAGVRHTARNGGKTVSKRLYGYKDR